MGKRESNIELLRIVSIVMITFHHLALRGGALEANTNINRIVGQFTVIGGKIGVNCFVLITGFFLSSRTREPVKVLKIWMQLLLYSLLLLAVCRIGFGNSLGIADIISYALPATFNLYWFCTAILGLYILSPIINKTLRDISQKQTRSLILVLTFMLVIVTNFTNQEPFYSDLTWFIYLYLISAYIRQINLKTLKNKYNIKKLSLICSISIWFLIFSSILMFEYLGKHFEIFDKAKYFFISTSSILVLVDSIAIFLFFISLPKFSSKAINLISKHSFGMYLIQSHPMLSAYLYKFVINIQLAESRYLFIVGISYTITLYLLAYIIDFINTLVIEKLFIKNIIKTNLWSKIDNILRF